MLGVFLHRERGYAIATWGLLFGINALLVGLLQYPVARWAAHHSPRAILALGTLATGAALFVLWPASPLPLVVVAIITLTFGEMLVVPVATALAAALAPTALRGSYQGVLDLGFAAFWAPVVFTGLWLVGRGIGEVALVSALPLAALGALCFLSLPHRPIRAEDAVPARTQDVVFP